MTTPVARDRAAFDALVQRAVMATVSAVPERPIDRRRRAAEEAQLLESQTREFADAVDRSGTGLSYADAVVVLGTAGPVVVSVDDYDRERLYYEARAGEVDLVLSGPLLIGLLDR